MSIPGSAHPLLLSSLEEEGYFIERSLRFNSSDSAYLSRTPASAGNRKTWTWAGWVKRSAISSGSYMDLFTALTGANDFTEIRYHFNANDDALMLSHVAGGVGYYVYSSNVFRDPSSWYHVVVAVDTTQSTSTNRVKIYVNGVQVTQNASGGYPIQNSDTSVNATAEHRHGSINTYGRFFSGYLADIHFIDGQALDPTSFGEFSATTGVWVPKAYTGSYGTNGFRLDFADNASTTTIGYDAAGSNDWTPNNLSVTAGAGNDSLVDVPTNGAETDTGAGGQVRGNYCTLNPLHQSAATLSNGNLDCSIVGGWVGSTVHMSTGKWYAEFTLGSGSSIQMFGICTSVQSGSGYPWQASTPNVTYYAADGRIYVDGVNTGTSGSASATAGDIISLAFDADAKSVAIRKNNSLLVTKTIGTATSYMFYVSDGGGTIAATFNAGARPFAYTAPSGFKALNTANLPAPLVTKPNTVMDVKLYTGTGATQNITGLAFSPDLVWAKVRNTTGNHSLYDIVRGATQRLASSTTSAEATFTNSLTSFDSGGFSLGSNPDGDVNASGNTYVAWTWDAGSSTVTNTQGSIASQVRANVSAGFSVVTYTGTGAAGSVGHGLGVTPGMIIVKARSNTTNNDWMVYHSRLANPPQDALRLNSTGTPYTNNTYPWNSSVTSTVFGVSPDSSYGISSSGVGYVAYCFAPVAGYSSFGSYTGNGSADGPFVYLGFRPALVMVKMSSSTGNWTILDDKREGYNVDNDPLFPNLSNAEGTTDLIDITSNGFKVRTTDATFNTNAGTYIYAAWASSPFAYSRAR